MIRASRPIPQATTKRRSSVALGDPRVARPGPPPRPAQIEDAGPTLPDGGDGRSDTADAEGPGQDIPGPAGHDRQGRRTADERLGRLADRPVAAHDHDDGGVLRSGEGGACGLEAAGLDQRRPPVPTLDGAGHVGHDPLAVGRVGQASRARVDEDQRRAGAGGVGGHDGMLSDRSLAVGTFRRSGLDSAPLTTPQVRWDPKTRTRPPRTARRAVPARSPPVGFRNGPLDLPTLLPCVFAGATPIAVAPSAMSR